MIDSEQASRALADIDDIAKRVRQSTIYQLASLMMIMWGLLVVGGNLATYLTPRYAGYAWLAVYGVGIAGWVALSASHYGRMRIRTFDARMLLAFLLFLAFGMFTGALGHFHARQLSTFWTIYFMLAYTIAGLWTGVAFVAIGLSITALTLIGYFYIGQGFDLWMAAVNGGGLILGGLWMRRE